MEKAHDIVLPQAEHIYQGVLARNGRSELREMCKDFGLEEDLYMSLTAKELVVLFLSVIRVLPSTQ